MLFSRHLGKIWSKKPFLMPIFGLALVPMMLLGTASVCRAKSLTEEDEITYLKKLSIENLLKIEVTSVSKKTETLSNAAAAVFVITADDIRRSGATSIPEALRMVPGLQVARIDANKWAITARGFNGRYANKLLVLMDGRSIYTPLYSGVFWDIQDTLLEDLDRIEVIRGPGATLWGANAVNGVINIMTKHAKDTQGGFVSAGYGSEEVGFGSARFGTTLGEDGFIRAYVKAFEREESVFPGGDDAHDDWASLRGGFRADWDGSDHNAYTLQGDIYDVRSGQTVITRTLLPPYSETINSDIESKGGNILFRWTRSLSASEMSLQTYVERNLHKEVLGYDQQNTYDMDFQHQFGFLDNHEIIWGIGYRYLKDHIRGTRNVNVIPDRRSDDLVSAFIQDGIRFFDEKLCLTLGSKFEHNDYSGFEVQPSVRMSWLPNEKNSFWGSISRAVRTPSRGEQTGQFPFSTIPPGYPPNFDPANPASVNYIGLESLDSEVVIAYELGYRFSPGKRLMMDLAGFFNDFKKINDFVPGMMPYFSPTPVPHWILPIYPNNDGEGKTYGIELAGVWNVTEAFRVQPAYAYLKMDIEANRFNGRSPYHTFSVRTSLDVSNNLELDIWARYVDELPDPHVKDYLTLDLRLGWKPNKNIELSLVGQNLLDKYHPEFDADLPMEVLPTQVERSFYLKIDWRF